MVHHDSAGRPIYGSFIAVREFSLFIDKLRCGPSTLRELSSCTVLCSVLLRWNGWQKKVNRHRSSRNNVGVPTTRPMLIEVGSKVAHNATLPTKSEPPLGCRRWCVWLWIVTFSPNARVIPMHLESIASQIVYGWDSFFFMHASGKLAPYQGGTDQRSIIAVVQYFSTYRVTISPLQSEGVLWTSKLLFLL